MLVNVDAKGLELVCAAYLSQDPILCNEILSGIDTHGDNQVKFGLPERVIAKVFVFRLIYGGSAYSYANDPDFMGISTKQSYWQGVIDAFYEKYDGMAKWHSALVAEATTTGKLRMPTGRVYYFNPSERNGDLVWPRSKILNYPVQGLGADLVCICRVLVAKKLREHKLFEVKLISTIHDSIVVDTPSKYLKEVVNIFNEAFNEIPSAFESLFGKPFNLPTRCEIQYGMNKKDLTDY